jgi:predicted aconitase with swiveling domain
MRAGLGGIGGRVTMAEHKVTGRGMVMGRVQGPALVCHEAFSFLGDVDMDTGEIIARGHEHEGKSIAGTVLLYPETKGSSGGCLVLGVLAKQGKKPLAIVLEKPADPNIVEGAIVAEVALVCEPQVSLLDAVPNGAQVTVDGTTGEVSWSD